MAVGTLVVTPSALYEQEQATITLTITDFEFTGLVDQRYYLGFYLPSGWAFDPSSNAELTQGSTAPNWQFFPYDADCYKIALTGLATPKVISFRAWAERTVSAGEIYAKIESTSRLIAGGQVYKVATTIASAAVTINQVVDQSVSFSEPQYTTPSGAAVDIAVSLSSGATAASIASKSPSIRCLFTADGCDVVSVSGDAGWEITAGSAERGFDKTVWAGTISPTFTVRPRVGAVGKKSASVQMYANWTTSYGKTVSEQASGSSEIIIPGIVGSTTTPTAPNGLTATKTGITTISLAWTDNSDNETEFNIYRRTGAADPWVKVSSVGTNAVSFNDTGLVGNTLYRYAVSAVNSNASTPESALSAEATATTDPPPVAPAAPNGLSATAVSARSVRLTWVDNSNNETSFDIGRSAATGGPYAVVASVGADSTSYLDNDVSPQTTLYYAARAVNEAGPSAWSAEATATTPEDPSNIMDATANFSLSPGARVSMRQVAGRLFVYSDLDRPLVFVNRRWFQQGVKPQLTAATTSSVNVGALTGTFTVYICLYRSDDFTRSVPGPASTPITLSAKKIKVDPPTTGGKVTTRDIGYDQNGTLIEGADFWEIYLTETNLDGAYMVARLPITTTTWTSSATLAKDGSTDPINNGSRRPMEVNFESLIPPACAYSEFFNNRVVLFGERTIDAQTGAKLTITSGQTYFTVSGMTATDNLYHKELYLNRRATGWFVVDVESGTKVHIRHSDPDINSGGFNGTTGTYSIFAFAGKPGRFYASAYFSGEAAGGITFSPETFPPLTIFENELDPDDNQDPNGCISSRDSLFLFKPGKAFRITGGVEPDFPLYGVTPISRGSGLLATNTVCRDRDDNIYFLSDQGPHRARQSVIEKVGSAARAAWMFQKLFDISSAEDAVGMWFSREDQFVVFGLNRIGGSGNRDGFIYDSRTNIVCPFTTPTRITACTQTQRDDGGYQIIVGDEIGRIGTFLTIGQWRDNRDFTVESPTSAESGVSCYVQSGLLQDGRYISPQWWIPRLRSVPDGTPFYYTIAFDAKRRGDDPYTFTSDFERTMRSNLTNRVYSKAKQMEACVLRVSFDTVKDSRIEFNTLDMAFNSYGAS